MKIAAIDLGSNSFHIIIVEVSASGTFQVIDRLRLCCEAEGNCDLELWGVPRCTQLLEEALGRPVRVETLERESQSAVRRAKA